MLQRDIYVHDYTVKYYSDVSQKRFYQDMVDNKSLHYILLKNQDVLDHERIQNIRDYSSLLCVLSSIAVIWQFNNIPRLNRIKSKWWRFIWKANILILPYAFIYIYTSELKEKSLWDNYVRNFRKYCLYKQTGDYTSLDSSIKII